MKTTHVLAAGILASVLSVASAQAANAVVVTTDSSAGNALAIDVSGDGKATGFQLRVVTPGANGGSCKLQLPGDFQGACSVKAGVVRVAAFSPTGAALPSTLGSAAIVSLDKNVASSSMRITNVEFADGAGQSLAFRANIDGTAVKATKAGVAK